MHPHVLGDTQVADLGNSTANATDGTNLEASGTDYLIETIQYVLDTIVTGLFGSCMGTNSTFYEYLAGASPADEALALEQVKQAQTALDLAIQQEVALKAKLDKKSDSAARVEGELDTVRSRIKGLEAVKDAHKSSAKPVPPILLSDLMAAKSQLPGLQERAAKKKSDLAALQQVRPSVFAFAFFSIVCVPR